ncbi:UNVERIFIED_CONTAM: hypothetical protein Sindi_1277200 [Sesamum indicum]
MEIQQNDAAAESESAAEIPGFSAAFLAGKQLEDELGMKLPSDSAITASKMMMKNTSMGGNSVENFRNTKVSNSHSSIFIGNIPLHTSSDNCLDEDKIAGAFNNSSRKMLTYIAPTKQNGEIVVRPSLDIVRDGSKRWKSTAVGYFLGKRPYYHHLKEFAHSVWPALREVTAIVNGFFFFRFKIVIDMEEVIEGGPWLFSRTADCTTEVGTGDGYEEVEVYQVPVWIKLRHLPMEFWTTEGLSTVASGVGKPLYPDAITRACTRLDFARVCVMIDVTQKIKKHIIIMTPDEDGGETPCKVDVEYEWLPAKCTDCMTLGHSVKDCTLNKPRKPTKPLIAGSSTLNHTADETPRREENDVHVERTVQQSIGLSLDRPRDTPQSVKSNRANRIRHINTQDPLSNIIYKEVVIYNAFDALHLLDDAEEPTKGPNISTPDLVSEYRLHFLGILETRVRLNNVMPIQSFLLPQWKWFVDYATIGNREQFRHYRVTSRTDNEVVTITNVYGASEVIDRRALWTTLGTMAQQCTDEPWLVGGDFNAVRDLNEVCGISRDIRMAMEEFNAGIKEAGLLPLPMQGEWYTWDNCSTTTRSLWKQLDRILINDRWLARFPTSSYHCLTPRTFFFFW